MFDQTSQSLAPLLLVNSDEPRAMFGQQTVTHVGVRDAASNKQVGHEPIRLSMIGHGHSALDNRLAVALDYMSHHLDKPMKIPVLTGLVGLSASRFFELFKQATGHTPLNWFIRARMRWACELLNNSNLQIKKVAAQVGYEDPFYFSRLFKSVYGIAPYEYRKQNIKVISSARVHDIVTCQRPSV